MLTTMLMASTSLVPQHTLGGHYTPEGSSTPRETEVTDHPLRSQGWEVQPGGSRLSIPVPGLSPGSASGGGVRGVTAGVQRDTSTKPDSETGQGLSANLLLLVHRGDHDSWRGRSSSRSLARWRRHWTQAASEMLGCPSPQSRQRLFPPRGSKRSYSTPGLSANGPEGAGPWRPVGRQVRPPPAALPLAWPSPGRLHRLGARSSPAPSLLGDRWVEPPSRQRKQSED